MSRVGWAAVIVLAVLALVLNASLFTVDQTEQALVTQFGQPVRVIEQPGLHVKIPFMQTVIPFDKRLIYFEVPGEEVILGDQRRLLVDSFAMFRITNPLKTYQAVGPSEDGITTRLGSIESSALRRVLADNNLLDVLSAKRGEIMKTVGDEVNAEMVGFGVTIVDVRLRRADLPAGNTQAVLARMQSERERIAKRARAEGAEAAQKIRANAERERTVLLADANAKADQLRGEGEATASRIYAQAYQQDPSFFAFWRTMQAYRSAFDAGKSRLVLTPDDDFLKLLQTEPVPQTGSAQGAPPH